MKIIKLPKTLNLGLVCIALMSVVVPCFAGYDYGMPGANVEGKISHYSADVVNGNDYDRVPPEHDMNFDNGTILTILGPEGTIRNGGIFPTNDSIVSEGQIVNFQLAIIDPDTLKTNKMTQPKTIYCDANWQGHYTAVIHLDNATFSGIVGDTDRTIIMGNINGGGLTYTKIYIDPVLTMNAEGIKDGKYSVNPTPKLTSNQT